MRQRRKIQLEHDLCRRGAVRGGAAGSAARVDRGGAATVSTQRTVGSGAVLPVGGSGEVFENSNPRCVSVNLTGLTLPESVRIKITMVLIAKNTDTDTADFAVVGDGGGCPDNPCPATYSHPGTDPVMPTSHR